MIQEFITITKEEYLNLKTAEATLDALESGGVDNWEWYTDSLLDYLRETESVYPDFKKWLCERGSDPDDFGFTDIAEYELEKYVCQT